MKLAYRLELYRSARLDVPVELVRRADALGYHSVWSAESIFCLRLCLRLRLGPLA